MLATVSLPRSEWQPPPDDVPPPIGPVELPPGQPEVPPLPPDEIPLGPNEVPKPPPPELSRRPRQIAPCSTRSSSSRHYYVFRREPRRRTIPATFDQQGAVMGVEPIVSRWENLRTADVQVRERLNNLERSWVVGRLVAQPGVNGASWRGDSSPRLSIEYDADAVSGAELLDVLQMCGLHVRPVLLTKPRPETAVA